MKKLLALAACAALLAGCDLLSGAADEVNEEIDDITNRPPPVAFSTLTLLDSPLPLDEDGSGPDLYVEIQDGAGGGVYSAPRVAEDADEGVFPFVLRDGGELAGTERSYFVVVMDRDADGYDYIASSRAFTAEHLRESPTDTFAVADAAGTLRAELVIER
jgi:hypothetical protein